MVNVIDASIAIKWFVEEPGQEPALELLQEVLRKPRTFAVPEIFYFELVHVFHQVVEAPSLIQEELLRQLICLGLQRFAMTPDLLAETRRMQARGLSGYDGAYVALAKLVKGVWITADRKAHQKVAALGVSRLL